MKFKDLDVGDYFSSISSNLYKKTSISNSLQIGIDPIDQRQYNYYDNVEITQNKLTSDLTLLDNQSPNGRIKNQSLIITHSFTHQIN